MRSDWLLMRTQRSEQWRVTDMADIDKDRDPVDDGQLETGNHIGR